MAFESVCEFIESTGSERTWRRHHPPGGRSDPSQLINHGMPISGLLSASLERWSLPPSEDLAPLAPEHATREDFQPPRVQPYGGERIGSRAIPSRNDRRVVPDRLGPIEKKIPHHDPRLVIEGPGRPAFGDAGVMRGRPVVQRNVRARVKVGAFEGCRAGTYPADEPRAIPFPVGV